MIIQISERAAEYFKTEIIKAGALGLRLGVKKSGCANFKYVVELADDWQSLEEIFESQGIQLGIKTEHLPYLKDLILDWVKEGLNETLEFKNPNAVAHCGCGESFAVKNLELELPKTD